MSMNITIGYEHSPITGRTEEVWCRREMVVPKMVNPTSLQLDSPWIAMCFHIGQPVGDGNVIAIDPVQRLVTLSEPYNGDPVEVVLPIDAAELTRAINIAGVSQAVKDALSIMEVIQE